MHTSSIILVAEDDPDDRLLTQQAVDENGLIGTLRFVEDGEELVDYLLRRGKFQDAHDAPIPCLILLDLNMPRKDGREALEEIKNHPGLCHIPIIVLTTSKAEDDINRAYQLGVNSYITKPGPFHELVQVIGLIGKYWLETVELPALAPNL